MKDVASMIRSLHYASYAALYGMVPGIVPSGASTPELEKWARAWYRCVSVNFVSAYLERAGGASFVPGSKAQVRGLIFSYALEKAFLEVQYEMENRPDWARIPIHGILDLIGHWEMQETTVAPGIS